MRGASAAGTAGGGGEYPRPELARHIVASGRLSMAARLLVVSALHAPRRGIPRLECFPMMRNSFAAFSLALAFPVVAPAQGIEAINRARTAAATASQRNDAVDQQAQQATQQGKPAAPSSPQGGATPQGAQGGAQQGAQQPPVPRPTRPLPKIQPSAAAPAALPSDIPGTHTVVKGETLWGIAQRFLKDPYLWPEIYRLNTDVVEDPRWIYEGEVLRLRRAEGAAPAEVTALAVKEPGAPAAAPAAEPIAPEEPQGGATVFSEFHVRIGTASRAATIARVQPVVRTGEYTSAPFVSASGGPAWSGRITDVLTPSGVDYDRSDRAIQLAELVTINPPSGTPAAVGSRYLVIRPGGLVKGYGDLAIPTGIVQVEVAERGKAPVARVKQIFEAIRPGQGLLPYERLQRDSLARPTPVANGPMTSVVHVHSDPALPTLQAFVVLSTRGLGAVRPGDVFALVREAGKTSTGAVVPEEVLATVQVVRVTPQAATAVLTGQATGGIKEGMPARLVARMPAS